ncbi:prephenate dehydratase [Halosquirtibacter xylanolyticus]|uniref:prephenate dehydratase n=1 Tax=Halosquirtibacter xylanolyticus TaxID=3374599 RepID=UPI003749D016|nr:prephenate dehydratase [Prolixibacteraceae bacterium]
MKRVSIQGIKGSFHEDAALKYFKNEEVEIVECKTFKQAVEMVDKDHVDLCVMAIENSIAGSLLGNYSLMRQYHLRIIGEVYLHIEMNLLMNKGADPQKIKEIHSHPIALKQCMEYIEKHAQEAILLEKSDTAGAAKALMESKRTDVATIGNTRTSELYELEIKEKGIETNKRNYTRFLVLTKQSKTTLENNKTSICFECGHYHGSLANVLKIFSEYEINLTKIQSIPILGKPEEYSFHVDLEYLDQDKYEKAIHKALKNVSSLSILGEYKKGIMPR